MAKKDKKHKKVEPVVVEEEEIFVEPEEIVEEVQFTDTSYTSASFESLPPVIEEIKPKEKKKKGKKGKEVEEQVVQEVSDTFNWSEDELPVIEEQVKEEQVVEEKAKKKKGKGKGKKEEKEEIPDFPKPKNWNGMNKKDREVWLEQQIEEWRAQKEAEKQALLAGVKEKRLQEAKDRATLMANDKAQQEIRRDLLVKTVALFEKNENMKKNDNLMKQKEEEWQQYIRCDGLPDPRVVTQMNTYIHLWQNVEINSEDELEKRCIEVLPMLAILEEFVANSRQYTALQAQGYNEVRLALREQLAYAIEYTSYTLLRHIEENLKMESLQLATYERKFNGLRLNVWVAVRMPTKKPLPEEPPPVPIELNFPAIKVGVKLPTIIDGSALCVRAARTMLDLLSESSRSFHLTHEMADRYTDLFVFNVKEHIDVSELKHKQDEIRTKFFKETKEKIKELEAFLKANVYAKDKGKEEELERLQLAEPSGLPDPRTYISEQNEIRFRKYLKSCFIRARTGELNLRKYRICGGILYLDLLNTPPQPKRMEREIDITTLSLPKKLQSMKYQVQYRAPAPPPAGVTRTPEEIEAEMKKIEAEYEKLALVHIELPDDVMWLEPPVVCQWQEAKNLWTSNYINDFKYNEDKLILQFRTGVLWPIGLGTLRYNNLPYQGWDMKPDPEGKGVILQVTGLGVTVTWLCISNYVKLKWVTNSSALKEHYNKKYSVKKMVQVMQAASCDFFPEFDAHNYLEGSCSKEWVVERHNYHAMAFLSRAYNFQWSRWNVTAGSRNIVMQVREAVDKKREGNLSLLYVTPQQAKILKCNEMSQEFSSETMAGFPFFADLFTMNLSYGSVDARRMVWTMKYQLVETVFEMLQELKLCSFS